MSFLLLWIIPGLAWSLLIPRDALDHIERLAVGLGLNFVIAPVITLLLTYLPGPLSRSALLAAMIAAIAPPVALFAIKHKQKGVSLPKLSPGNWQQDGWAWLLIAVLIAFGLRTVHLGYAEFQGDEAAAMMRAAHALTGNEAAIFQHKKGPAELLVVMSSWRLTASQVKGFDELAARLPFAWASIIGVMTVFLIGRRLDHPRAGGIAACILAIEGYLVGFGRIVQYQSLVFALSALGLLCLLAYEANGHGILLTLAAAFFAGGALAHYDAVLTLPAGLLLLGTRLWRDRAKGWRALRPTLIAAMLGAALAGLFYIPFMRSPYAGTTSTYLAGRLGGIGRIHNHLWPTFERSAVYDSVYLLAALSLALAAQVMITWHKWGYLELGIAAALLAAMGSGLLWPELWSTGDTSYAWVPALLLLIGSPLAPGQSMGRRAMWLWLGVPGLFYIFFVALPLTHIYTAIPAWAMLAGLALANGTSASAGRYVQREQNDNNFAPMHKTISRVAIACGVALYAVCGYYTVMVFVDHMPEYRRTFPQHKHPLYWLPYDEIPQEGLFGFPYRAGWKIVGHLMDTGELSGTYDSNEEHEITDFYTRQATRLSCASPEMYIIAANVQDEVPVRWDQIEAEYQPAVVVTANGQPKLTVYKRGATGQPQTYAAEAYDRTFARSSTPERIASSALDYVLSTSPPNYSLHEATIGEFAKLRGYKIDASRAVPGGYVELTLVWEALGPAPIDYQIFTHLHDGERMQGQQDGPPVCGNHPTSRWQAGQLIIDPHRIPLKPDAQPGPVPLTVGMYDLATMQRLPALTPAGSPVGDHVYLTEVMIQEP